MAVTHNRIEAVPLSRSDSVAEFVFKDYGIIRNFLIAGASVLEHVS